MGSTGNTAADVREQIIEYCDRKLNFVAWLNVDSGKNFVVLQEYTTRLKILMIGILLFLEKKIKSSTTQTYTCMLFTFENGVMLMR